MSYGLTTRFVSERRSQPCVAVPARPILPVVATLGGRGPVQVAVPISVSAGDVGSSLEGSFLGPVHRSHEVAVKVTVPF